MSFVVVGPDVVVSAAAVLSRIGSGVGAANAVGSGPDDSFGGGCG